MDQFSSKSWRERGNNLFGMATDESKEAIKRDHLEDALHCYGKAIENADSDSDKISATKNMALTEWELARIRTDKADYFFSAIKHFDDALNQGRDTNSVGWVQKVQTNMNKCFDEAVEFVNTIQSFTKRLQFMRKIENSVDSQNVKKECCKYLGEDLYKEGIAASKDNNLTKAMDLLKEASMPLERARSLARCQIMDLEGKIQKAMKQIQVQMYLETARNRFKKANEMQKNGETLDEDTMFGVIDACQQAMQIAGEESFETEAECLSYLGLVYKEILHDRVRAKEYFLRSVQLCDCISRQSFVLTEWYSMCTQNLQSFQQETVKQEERSRHEFVQKELKQEMAILKEGQDKYSTDICGLICYITSSFPLSETSNPVPDIKELNKKSLGEIKSVCRKLVLRYHSDRQKVQEKKRKMLCEEITKVLNGIMEKIKASE